jgi:hypothetical protein
MKMRASTTRKVEPTSSQRSDATVWATAPGPPLPLNLHAAALSAVTNQNTGMVAAQATMHHGHSAPIT